MRLAPKMRAYSSMARHAFWWLSSVYKHGFILGDSCAISCCHQQVLCGAGCGLVTKPLFLQNWVRLVQLTYWNLMFLEIYIWNINIYEVVQLQKKTRSIPGDTDSVVYQPEPEPSRFLLRKIRSIVEFCRNFTWHDLHDKFYMFFFPSAWVSVGHINDKALIFYLLITYQIL